MKNKQSLLLAICLLVMPLAIGCTDNTSSNTSNSEEEIQAEIREDLEESRQLEEEQQREREEQIQEEQQRERAERLAECRRSRTPFNATPEEIQQIALDCLVEVP